MVHVLFVESAKSRIRLHGRADRSYPLMFKIEQRTLFSCSGLNTNGFQGCPYFGRFLFLSLNIHLEEIDMIRVTTYNSIAKLSFPPLLE